MSLRNRCNQLNTTLYQLMMLFSFYKKGAEFEEVKELADRLKSFPELTIKKPELAQTEILFIIEQTEKTLAMISPEVWKEFKDKYNTAVKEIYE